MQWKDDHVRALLVSCNTTIKSNIPLFFKRGHKEGSCRVVERPFSNRLPSSAPQTSHSPGGTRTEAGRQNSETYLQHCLGSRIDSGGGGLLNSFHKAHCELLCLDAFDIPIWICGWLCDCRGCDGSKVPKSSSPEWENNDEDTNNASRNFCSETRAYYRYHARLAISVRNHTKQLEIRMNRKMESR